MVGTPIPPFKKGEGWGGGGVLERGVSDFCHKNGRVGKIGGVVSKKEGITYFHTNPFQCYLSECLVCVCLFCLFTPVSLSIICVSQE